MAGVTLDRMSDVTIDRMVNGTIGVIVGITAVVATPTVPLIQAMRPVQMNRSLMPKPAPRMGMSEGKTETRLYSGAHWSRRR